MSRIEKIKKILSMLIFICILISPIASLYFLHYSKQLTSKSFKEISLLNSEIKQLKAINEKVFRDREDLIFIINQHIAPEIFNRHYFLENYILRYNNVIQYYPKIDELKKAGVLDKDLITLKKKSFFNSDSIITELKEITFDKDNIDYNDYYTYEAYTMYTVANIDDLIIKSNEPVSLSDKEPIYEDLCANNLHRWFIKKLLWDDDQRELESKMAWEKFSEKFCPDCWHPVEETFFKLKNNKQSKLIVMEKQKDDNRVEEFFEELRNKSNSDTENSDMFRLRKGTFRKYFNTMKNKRNNGDHPPKKIK